MRSFNPRVLDEFARYYGFHYDISNPAILVRDILADMERGLKGQKSVLPMIPSYISPAAAMPPHKQVIALDAGGTNLRASMVHFTEDGKTVTEGTHKVPMPGTRGRVGAEQFFDQIAELTVPLFE